MIELERGSQVGNYILDECVGEGAFAQVWKCHHHERPNRVLAIKVAIDPSFRRRLAREGGLPEIDHPNVVPILDSDTRFSDIPYVVLPYYRKGSLAELLSRRSKYLREKKVRTLFRDIVAGLAAAHKISIAHRDIKPANILIGDDGSAVLADFGLSTYETADEALRSIVQSESNSTTEGTIAGTLAYMAPEVRDGQGATLSSDVFSVGIVMFEMLTGRRPIGPELPSQIRKRLKNLVDWDAVYAAACMPSDQRPQNAVELQELLQEEEDEEYGDETDEQSPPQPALKGVANLEGESKTVASFDDILVHRGLAADKPKMTPRIKTVGRVLAFLGRVLAFVGSLTALAYWFGGCAGHIGIDFVSRNHSITGPRRVLGGGFLGALLLGIAAVSLVQVLLEESWKKGAKIWISLGGAVLGLIAGGIRGAMSGHSGDVLALAVAWTWRGGLYSLFVAVALGVYTGDEKEYAIGFGISGAAIGAVCGAIGGGLYTQPDAASTAALFGAIVGFILSLWAAIAFESEL